MCDALGWFTCLHHRVVSADEGARLVLRTRQGLEVFQGDDAVPNGLVRVDGQLRAGTCGC